MCKKGDRKNEEVKRQVMLRDCESKQGRDGPEVANVKKQSVGMLLDPNHDDSGSAVIVHRAVAVAVIVRTVTIEIIVSIIVVTAVINVMVIGHVVVAHSMEGFLLAQVHHSCTAYPHIPCSNCPCSNCLCARTLNADTDIKLVSAA